MQGDSTAHAHLKYSFTSHVLDHWSGHNRHNNMVHKEEKRARGRVHARTARTLNHTPLTDQLKHCKEKHTTRHGWQPLSVLLPLLLGCPCIGARTKPTHAATGVPM